MSLCLLEAQITWHHGIHQWSPTSLCRMVSVTVIKLITCGKTFKVYHYMEHIGKNNDSDIPFVKGRHVYSDLLIFTQ